MLVSNVNGERVAGAIVKDSGFYIEIAKFVQAYTTIVKNPNEFLTEVGESTIDEENDRLSWAQFVKIVQACDLGFGVTPSATDLLVYYNYALEIGSLDGVSRRLASVDDVANAQKHYYNFVDDAAQKAHTEYVKHHSLTISKEKEVDEADKKLALIKTGNIVCFVFMLFGVFLMAVGVTSLFFDNFFVKIFEAFFKNSAYKYIGALIYIIIGFIVFAVADKYFIKTRNEYIKLKVATDIIFKRVDETIEEEMILKHKLDKLNKDLQTVQSELADKTKKYDVKHNIEVLKSSNKYYKKLCEKEEENIYASEEEYSNDVAINDGDSEEFAPVKLTKEQEENLRMVKKEAIGLEGILDEEAYNEKFEKSEKEKEKEEAKIKEQEEKQEEQEEQNFVDTLDYLKDILGIEEDEEKQRLNF